MRYGRQPSIHQLAFQTALYGRPLGDDAPTGVPDWAVATTTADGTTYYRAKDELSAGLVSAALAAYNVGELVLDDVDEAVGTGTYYEGRLSAAGKGDLLEVIAQAVPGNVGFAIVGNPLQGPQKVGVLFRSSIEQLQALTKKAGWDQPCVILKDPEGGWLSGYLGGQEARMSRALRIGSAIGGVTALGLLVWWSRKHG